MISFGVVLIMLSGGGEMKFSGLNSATKTEGAIGGYLIRRTIIQF